KKKKKRKRNVDNSPLITPEVANLIFLFACNRGGRSLLLLLLPITSLLFSLSISESDSKQKCCIRQSPIKSK
ncbi:unnamed protein product, partial [Citrullus colocynthis]